MERRLPRQGGRAAYGQDGWKNIVIMATIKALIELGTNDEIAERYAESYLEQNGIPIRVKLDSYIQQMVNSYLDSPESAISSTSPLHHPIVRVFDCGDDGKLQAVIQKTPADGDCFLWSMIAYRNYCLEKKIECPVFPLDVLELRAAVVKFISDNRNDNTISHFFFREYFKKNYGPQVPHPYRLQVHRSGQSSPEESRFFVDDVFTFFRVMSKSGTHVDEFFISAFARMFGLQIQVITQARSEVRPVQNTGCPKVDALIALGVSSNVAILLLNKYKGDVNQAMDEVLKEKDPEPVIDPSRMIWQKQIYGNSKESRVGIVCSSGHYELMLPPPISYHHPDPQIYLPPRVQTQKHPVSGGGAAVSVKSAAAVPVQPVQHCRISSAKGGAQVLHQQSPSFGHAQLDRAGLMQKCRQPCSSMVEYSGLHMHMSKLKCKDALYDFVSILVQKNTPYPVCFRVNDLMLNMVSLQRACKEGVWVFGSFGFIERDKTYLFRAVGFQFNDGSFVNHEDTAASLSDKMIKQAFTDRVNEKWQSSMITAITFAKCN